MPYIFDWQDQIAIQEDMLALFGKKKLSEDQVANIFVNSIIDSVERGFSEVAGFLNDSPEFVRTPGIKGTDYGKFLMVVVSGNFCRIPEYFDEGHDREIIKLSLRKFADIFEMETEQFAELIKQYKAFMNRVNHPSKNTLYAMSKAVFYKYNLNEFQEEYFRKLNTPNPIFLKNLDEVMKNFLWDWGTFSEKYKVVNA